MMSVSSVEAKAAAAAAAEVWEETEQGERERSYNNNPAIIRDNVKALMSST